MNIKVLPGDGLEFQVRVSPRSSRSGVQGLHGSALKVAVHAAPEKGRANEEVEAVLAEFLGLPARQIGVISGQTSRLKRVRAWGLTAEQMKARLDALEKS